jgi:hypothetical protein
MQYLTATDLEILGLRTILSDRYDHPKDGHMTGTVHPSTIRLVCSTDAQWVRMGMETAVVW